MSNFIIEEERGTYTGRRHPNNGYYAFTGPTTPTTGTRLLAPAYRPHHSARFAPVSDSRRPS